MSKYVEIMKQYDLRLGKILSSPFLKALGLNFELLPNIIDPKTSKISELYPICRPWE